MSQQVVMEYVGKYKAAIDQEIDRELSKRLADVHEISPHLVPIIETMRELSVGGERLRGLLTILGYEIAGGVVGPEIIRAAAVMELFHLGLLIQDDVMDRDNLRRGVKTLHFRYDDQHLGESLAICAGDLTFGWGMEVLAGLQLSTENVTRSIGVWGKYFTRVGYGQMLDVLAEHRGDSGEDEVLQVLLLKSGEYTCVLPLQLGASLGGADDELMDTLHTYGMELGWVFHLRDDWLGEYGDTTKTGKPVGNDVREKRRSFATLYGKDKTEAEIERHLLTGKKLLKRWNSPHIEVMASLLDWMATREN